MHIFSILRLGFGRLGYSVVGRLHGEDGASLSLSPRSVEAGEFGLAAAFSACVPAFAIAPLFVAVGAVVALFGAVVAVAIVLTFGKLFALYARTFIIKSRVRASAHVAGGKGGRTCNQK